MADMQSVAELKDQGNAAFAQGNAHHPIDLGHWRCLEGKWREAETFYSQALRIGKNVSSPETKATLLSNRSAAWAMLEDYDTALSDAERVLQLRPEWSRGYVRKSVALLGHNRVIEAVNTIAEGIRINPEDSMLFELKAQVHDLLPPNEHKRNRPETSTFTEALRQIEAAGVEQPISIVVLSGFLGAGKTTLLNRILTQLDGQMRIAVLVNDMAAINIDAELIRHDHHFSKVTEEIVEFTNGCVCCTLRGDLINVLGIFRKGVAHRDVSTGISEPMPVAATFTSVDLEGKSLKNYFNIDNMVTLVDGSEFLDQVKRDGYLREWGMEASESDDRSISTLLVEQVEFADTLLINKWDRISDHQRTTIRQFLESVNPSARILETTYANVDVNEIVATGRYRIDRAQKCVGFETEIIQPHTSETIEYGISSFVFSSKTPFHPVRLHRFFFSEAPTDETYISGDSQLRHVYRSKGFFYLASNPDVKLMWSTAGRSVSFEVSEQWLASMLPEHLWPESDPTWDPTFGDREQRIVIIGDVKQFSAIRQLLNTCLLTDNELESNWQSIDGGDLWQLDLESEEDESEETTLVM